MEDPDVAADFDGTLAVTLSVSNGTLALGTTAGLSVYTAPATWAATVSITGTAPAINSVLASLMYRPTPYFVGTDSLVVVADDQGFTGTGPPNVVVSPGLAITVAAAATVPSLHLPATVLTDEDSAVPLPVTLTGRAPQDATPFSVALLASPGTLALAANADTAAVAATVAAGGSLLTVAGSYADLVAAMHHVHYTPRQDWNSVLRGRDLVTGCASASDTPLAADATQARDAVCATTSVAVAAVNDAPVVALADALSGASGPVVVEEDGAVALMGVTVHDVDVSEAYEGVLRVTLAASHGTLALATEAGLLFDLPRPDPRQLHRAASLTFSGAPTDLNAALASIAYRPDPDYAGPDSLEVRVEDRGATGASYSGPDDDASLVDTATIALTVVAQNDAPLLSLPPAGLVATPEDTAVPLPGIAIADPDLGDAPISVELSVSHGTLSLGDLTYWIKFSRGTGTDDSALVFAGPLADINAALAGLTYTPSPNYNSRWQGRDALLMVADDGGASGAGGHGVTSGRLDIDVSPVNDAPTLDSSVLAFTIDEDAQVLLGSSLLAADDDAEESKTGTLALRLQASNGYLSLVPRGLLLVNGHRRGGPAPRTGLQQYGNDILLRGSMANINAALRTLAYQGERDWSGSDEVLLQLDDGGAYGAGGAQAASLTLTVSVTPANDAPVIALGPALLPSLQPLVVDEDTDLPLPGVSVSDVDLPSAYHLLTVSLATASGGAVTLDATHGVEFAGASGSGSALTFSGTLDAVNAALATLRYRGAPDWSGEDSVEVLVSDGGGGGSGGVRVAIAAIAVRVEPVNDAPVLTAPQAATTPVASTGSVLLPGMPMRPPSKPPPNTLTPLLPHPQSPLPTWTSTMTLAPQ